MFEYWGASFAVGEGGGEVRHVDRRSGMVVVVVMRMRMVMMVMMVVDGGGGGGIGEE